MAATIGRATTRAAQSAKRSRRDSRRRAERAWTILVYLCGDHPEIEEHIETNLRQIAAAGSPRNAHLVVQRDRRIGAERFVIPEAGGPIPEASESLAVVNSGHQSTLVEFLSWGLTTFPSRRVALLFGGTGVFESTVDQPFDSRANLFAILDDASADDALDVRELGAALAEVRTGLERREKLDLVCFDVCRLQFLEIVHELDAAVSVIVAPQTPVPARGWNYETLLTKWREQIDRRPEADLVVSGVSPIELARIVVAEGGIAYDEAAAADGLPPSGLSAVQLSGLDTVSNALDNLLIAMTQGLGENLIWRAREQILRGQAKISTDQLKPGHIPYDLGLLAMEIQHHMGMAALLPHLHWVDALAAAPQVGWRAKMLEYLADRLADPVSLDLDPQDAAVGALERMVAHAAHASRVLAAGRPEVSDRPAVAQADGAGEATEDVVAGVGQTFELGRDSVVAVIDEKREGAPTAGSLLTEYVDPDRECAPKIERRVSEILREAMHGRPDLRAPLEDELARLQVESEEARQVARLAQHLGQALQLDERADPQRFVIALHGDGKLSGISLYRPYHLDEMRELDYLKLRFHRRVHWASYLAAVNLIQLHPRVLWRLVNSLLSTASGVGRAAVLRRLVGPDSVMSGFREQLRALVPAPSLTISAERHREGGQHFYRLRLESNLVGPTVDEQHSRVNEESLETAIRRLEDLLGKPLLAPDEIDELVSIGRQFGQDILQDLHRRLENERTAWFRESGDDVPPPQLVLQVPRELMDFPWELIRDREGWLGTRWAVGRQVFMDAGTTRAVPHRKAGPIRALVIADPKLTFKGHPGQLASARAEGEAITAILTELAQGQGGLVQFDPREDTYVGEEVTVSKLRDLLDEGDYDIIHFAGHASFDPKDAERSSWLLSDGECWALNIRNCLAWSKSPPWLVFANACESSAESTRAKRRYQKEVFGLATAFINQGTATYIGSLWPIEDRIAQTIAVTFYEKLLKGRTSVGEALRCAREAAYAKVASASVRNGGGQPPELVPPARAFGWLSPVLYGDPTVTLTQVLGAALLVGGPAVADRGAARGDGTAAATPIGTARDEAEAAVPPRTP